MKSISPQYCHTLSGFTLNLLQAFRYMLAKRCVRITHLYNEKLHLEILHITLTWMFDIIKFCFQIANEYKFIQHLPSISRWCACKCLPNYQNKPSQMKLLHILSINGFYVFSERINVRKVCPCFAHTT